MLYKVHDSKRNRKIILLSNCVFCRENGRGVLFLCTAGKCSRIFCATNEADRKFAILNP